MRVLTNHGQSTSSLSSLFLYLLLYFIEFMRFNNFLYSKILCVNKILMVRLKNSNIKITHKHKIILANIYIYIYIPTYTLHSLQLRQCRVGAQSLGKRTRSLGANAVVIETGARGWERASTAREH